MHSGLRVVPFLFMGIFTTSYLSLSGSSSNRWSFLPVQGSLNETEKTTQPPPSNATEVTWQSIVAEIRNQPPPLPLNVTEVTSDIVQSLINTSLPPLHGYCRKFRPRFYRHREKFVELLSVLHNLTNALGFEYAIRGGSALGFVRHNKQPIPWDDDIDIDMTKAGLEKLFAVADSKEVRISDYYEKDEIIKAKNTIYKFRLPSTGGSKAVINEYCLNVFRGYDWNTCFKFYRCDGPEVPMNDYIFSYPLIDVFHVKMMQPTIVDTFMDVPVRIPQNIERRVMKELGANSLSACKSLHMQHQTDTHIPTVTRRCRDVMAECYNLENPDEEGTSTGYRAQYAADVASMYTFRQVIETEEDWRRRLQIDGEDPERYHFNGSKKGIVESPSVILERTIALVKEHSVMTKAKKDEYRKVMMDKDWFPAQIALNGPDNINQEMRDYIENISTWAVGA